MESSGTLSAFGGPAFGGATFLDGIALVAIFEGTRGLDAGDERMRICDLKTVGQKSSRLGSAATSDGKLPTESARYGKVAWA